jgi:hypothetical protein
MKLRTLALSLSLLALTLPTIASAQNFASSSDALTWISNHFETSNEITRVFNDAGAQEHFTTTTQKNSLTFDGCTVTLVIDQKFLHQEPGGKTDNDYSGIITQQFNLSNVVLSKIRVVNRDMESCYGTSTTPDCADKKGVANPPQLFTLILHGITPFPSSDTYWGKTTLSNLQIRFMTHDLADQQAKAWTAAVQACGGK